MGWATELQQASFRGVLFECVSTNDSTSKALAVQQAPYSNNSIIEDMGNDAEKISLRIFLSGIDYLLYLDALKTAFALTGTGELIHPIYGIKNVNVQNWSVSHNTETVDGCDIDVDFLVAKAERKTLFIPRSLPPELEYTHVILTPAAVLKSELEKLKSLDPNKFFKTINRIRNGLQSARRILNTVRSKIDNLLSPQDWAVGLVDDVVRLATFEFDDISAISKWRSLFDRVKRVSKIFDQDDEQLDSPAFRQIWRAMSIASTAAIAQAVVKQTRTELAQVQTANYSSVLKNAASSIYKSGEAIAGNQISTIQSNYKSGEAIAGSQISTIQSNRNTTTSRTFRSTFILTPIDLAVIRQHIRREIQQAIVAERTITQAQALQSNIDPALQVAQYKTLANDVHEQIQALIETRPPIRNTPILLTCTAHWLAHQLYGDMSRAEEIKHLNPSVFNFAVRSGMELITYAR